MPGSLTWTVAVLAAVLLLAATAYVVLDRTTDRWLLGVAGLLEVALVAELVVGIARIGDRAEGANAAVFVAYLVGLVLLPPVAGAWALGEPSRAGTAVWIVAAVVVPVLLLRISQVYDGA